MSSEKQKVLRLDYEQELDFLLIGLLCGLKDFRLCYDLNQNLGLDMVRKNDLVISAGRPGSSTRHACFAIVIGGCESYYLLSNRDIENTGCFIPEMRNVDYFLVISGMARNYDTKTLIEKLRSMKNISGAFLIEPAELKSAETFLSLLEN
jgi:hypothetical protein